MTMSRASSFALSVLFVGAACGGDDNKNYGDPINNPAAAAQAKTAVQAAASLSTIESDPDNDAALTNVSQLYSSAQVLLSAKLATQAGNQKPVFDGLRAMTDLVSKPLDASCYSAAAGRVTYTACDLGGAGTIDGTVSWGGGTYTVNLTMTLDTQGTEFSITQRGSITVSQTAITGNLDVTAEGSVQGVTFDYDISSDYDLVLSGGQATDGSLEVHGAWSVRSPQGNASYDLWVKAEFDGATVTLY